MRQARSVGTKSLISALVQSCKTPAVQRRRDQDGPASDVHVHVRLFGALASITNAKPFCAEAGNGKSRFGSIGRTSGGAFLARVLDETGAKRRYCRLLVAGVPIEDLQTAIDTDSIEIEMILLVAIEGG